MQILKPLLEMGRADWRAGAPAPRHWRILFTLAVAVFSGGVAYWLIGRADYTSDLLHFWFATRTFLGGGDPYTVPLPVQLNPGLDPALYPLPTYLLFAPFAGLPLALAGGAFMAFGAGLAAWGVSGTGMVRAPIFLSAPFLLSLSLGQWSPLLVGAMLVPWASWLLVAKPNMGLAAWIARPDWKTAVAVCVIVAASVTITPDWPASWIANVGNREEKFIPLLRPGGFLLVLSVLAWRRPEGRLLMAMSLMPQALFFYYQLLLWLVPRTFRQSLILSVCSFLAFLAWQHGLAPGDFYVKEAVPFAYSLYLVSLAMLLWNWWGDRGARPPVGPGPA